MGLHPRLRLCLHRHLRRRTPHLHRLPAQPRINLRDLRPILRLPSQAPRNDLAKRDRQIRRQHDHAPAAEQPQRLTPRERFANGYAQRPDIARSRTVPVTRFRRVVHRQRFDVIDFANRSNRIARQLQLIADDEHVRWLQPPEHELPLVQERQCGQRRHQHLAHFLFRKRATLQKLRQILVGVLHHGIEIAKTGDVAAPHVQEAHQIRMRERRGGVPPRKLRLEARERKRDELQRNVGRRNLCRLSEKNAAVLGTPEKATQGKLALDDLPFQPRPDPADRRACFCAHG
jgi:hypothetical protein